MSFGISIDLSANYVIVQAVTILLNEGMMFFYSVFNDFVSRNHGKHHNHLIGKHNPALSHSQLITLFTPGNW